MTDTPKLAAPVHEWRQQMKDLPLTWPSSLAEQAADPLVRAVILNAYEARASMNDICAATGRSRALVRLILVEEKVLRSRGRSQRSSAVLEGHASWLEAVTGVLRGRMADGIYPVGSALPSVRMLSAEVDARPWAVHEAIHRLKSEGLLLPVPSYGTVVTDPRNVPELVAAVGFGDRTEYWPLPRTGARRAEQLRQSVLRGLDDGTYTPGPLPEVADLAREFAVPAYLLGRVLAPLEKRGLLAWRPQGLHVLATPRLPSAQPEGGKRAA